MHATIAFLNWTLALGTLVSSYLVSPVLIHLLLHLFARLPLMPVDHAFVTEVLTTGLASDSSCSFDLSVHSFTIGKRTEALIMRVSNVEIQYELLELGMRLSTT